MTGRLILVVLAALGWALWQRLRLSFRKDRSSRRPLAHSESLRRCDRCRCFVPAAHEQMEQSGDFVCDRCRQSRRPHG